MTKTQSTMRLVNSRTVQAILRTAIFEAFRYRLTNVPRGECLSVSSMLDLGKRALMAATKRGIPVRALMPRPPSHWELEIGHIKLP